ncbi:hypothetical protein OPV22_007737 [Ensete ventricosum]|uniref:C2 domain-containing protein n=1 Tax=Ensete ventricosum TaxID=4639 RepID=A0AAV8RTZ7_ENSVE|nr:hypothetical protein OPV22_007737 [Ensete ventricosum]
MEVTLISAEDLDDVNVFTKMHVYAVVSFASKPRFRRRTPTDKNGGKSPSWNATFRLLVPVDPAAARRLVLHVLLRSERILGDRDVGEVYIPLTELLVDGGDKPSSSSSGPQFVSYQVRKTGSGKPQGVLNLSYKFLDAYPAAASIPAGYSAPGTYPKPANPVTVKPAPRSRGLEYATAGNDSHANTAPSHARDGYGAGMDAGLLAGAIGGLLIGEMVSDAASYAGGFGDGGGCDF